MTDLWDTIDRLEGRRKEVLLDARLAASLEEDEESKRRAGDKQRRRTRTTNAELRGIAETLDYLRSLCGSDYTPEQIETTILLLASRTKDYLPEKKSAQDLEPIYS